MAESKYVQLKVLLHKASNSAYFRKTQCEPIHSREVDKKATFYFVRIIWTSLKMQRNADHLTANEMIEISTGKLFWELSSGHFVTSN